MTLFAHVFDTRGMSEQRAVEPPKPVEIHVDDRWRPGELQAWSREPDGWYGHVKNELGMMRWLHADQIRPVIDAARPGPKR